MILEDLSEISKRISACKLHAIAASLKRVWNQASEDTARSCGTHSVQIEWSVLRFLGGVLGKARTCGGSREEEVEVETALSTSQAGALILLHMRNLPYLPITKPQQYHVGAYDSNLAA